MTACLMLSVYLEDILGLPQTSICCLLWVYKINPLPLVLRKNQRCNFWTGVSRTSECLEVRLADLKFADIPNGIQALYKMPAEAGRSGVEKPCTKFGGTQGIRVHFSSAIDLPIEITNSEPNDSFLFFPLLGTHKSTSCFTVSVETQSDPTS